MLVEPSARYRSPDEDSARWEGFVFRDGDIVVSTRSKCGTTWVQMICALLIFQSPELPAPLAALSPWLDFLAAPLDDVLGRLEAQDHRRVVKTHTPLDGIPLDDRATYLVVGRHPLDMAVSLYHQGDNIDRVRLAELTGHRVEDGAPRPALKQWLSGWVDWEPEPREWLDSLPGVFHHITDAWNRQDRANVVLLHYARLSAHLEGEMRGLAARLGIAVAEERWPELVAAAGFPAMRGRATDLGPDRSGVLLDPVTFFREGRNGRGEEILGPPGTARYRARARALATAEVATWIETGSGIRS